MISRRSLLMGATTVSASVSGCLGAFTSAPPVDEIEVRMADVREPDRGVTSVTIPVILEIANTAGREIPSPSVQYSVQLNQTRIAESSEKLTDIPANSAATEEFGILIQYADVGESLAAVIQNGGEEISLEILGSIESGDASTEFSDEYSYSFA